jgi:acid phosphatase
MLIKRKIIPLNLSIFLITISFFSISCSSSNLINLDITKEKIINYHESGKYDRDLTDVINSARNKFKDILVTENDVVIFDVDETALSNYAFLKEIGFGYEADIWNNWINQEESPAIIPVRDFYFELLTKGIHVIFVSGRTNSQYDATYKNLNAAGYYNFDTLITRNSYESNMNTLEYKSSKREELKAKGYKILGIVGDQWSDLEGPDHGIQIKIPNYMYIIK